MTTESMPDEELRMENDVFAISEALRHQGYDYAAQLLLAQWRRAKKFRTEAHALTEERDQAVTELQASRARIAELEAALLRRVALGF